MKPAFKSFFLLIALLIATGLINYLFRKKMPDSYAEVFSYNRLYAVKEQLNLVYLGKTGKDSVTVRFSGKNIGDKNHFEIFSEQSKIGDVYGPFLTFRPFAQPKQYLIRINGADSLLIKIEIPGENLPIEFSANRPVVEEPLPSVGDWAWKGLSLANPESPQEIDSYLSDSMHVLPSDPSAEKVSKIARYLLGLMSGKFGKPADTMAGLSPLGQLNCIRSGRSFLLCGQCSSIFSFFSNRAGVPTRYIDCGQPENGLLNGPHAFNEVFLEERGGWAYTDLTEGNVFVRKNGRFLNVVDVQRMLRYPGPDSGFTALHYSGDSLLEKPFREVSNSATLAFNPGNTFHFYYGNYAAIANPRNPLEKLYSLLYPRPYYALYSDNLKIPGYSFYLRLISSYLFSLLFLITLFWVILYLARRIRRS